jgi:hypothetical protein
MIRKIISVNSAPTVLVTVSGAELTKLAQKKLNVIRLKNTFPIINQFQLFDIALKQLEIADGVQAIDLEPITEIKEMCEALKLSLDMKSLTETLQACEAQFSLLEHSENIEDIALLTQKYEQLFARFCEKMLAVTDVVPILGEIFNRLDAVFWSISKGPEDSKETMLIGRVDAFLKNCTGIDVSETTAAIEAYSDAAEGYAKNDKLMIIFAKLEELLPLIPGDRVELFPELQEILKIARYAGTAFEGVRQSIYGFIINSVQSDMSLRGIDIESETGLIKDVGTYNVFSRNQMRTNLELFKSNIFKVPVSLDELEEKYGSEVIAKIRENLQLRTLISLTSERQLTACDNLEQLSGLQALLTKENGYEDIIIKDEEICEKLSEIYLTGIEKEKYEADLDLELVRLRDLYSDGRLERVTDRISDIGTGEDVSFYDKVLTYEKFWTLFPTARQIRDEATLAETEQLAIGGSLMGASYLKFAGFSLEVLTEAVTPIIYKACGMPGGAFAPYNSFGSHAFTRTIPRLMHFADATIPNINKWMLSPLVETATPLLVDKYLISLYQTSIDTPISYATRMLISRTTGNLISEYFKASPIIGTIVNTGAGIAPMLLSTASTAYIGGSALVSVCADDLLDSTVTNSTARKIITAGLGITVAAGVAFGSMPVAIVGGGIILADGIKRLSNWFRSDPSPVHSHID